MTAQNTTHLELVARAWNIPRLPVEMHGPLSPSSIIVVSFTQEVVR